MMTRPRGLLVTSAVCFALALLAWLFGDWGGSRWVASVGVWSGLAAAALTDRGRR